MKPQVGGLRFHWLRVLKDDGPARNPRRIIELARTEPARADQRIRLRRDRVHTDARISIFDVKPTAARRCRHQTGDPGRSRPEGSRGVRVIAAAHGVSVNTVQRIAHAQ